MSHRFPLVAAVVGALVIGGATTGTTLALWHDRENLTGSVASGSMTFTVDGSSTATFAAVSSLALNNGNTAGSPHTFTATLAAGGEGKNLRMRLFVDDVTTSTAELDSGLEIALAGVADAADCPPSPPAAAYTPLISTNSVQVTDAASSGVLPGTSRVLCVALRVKANAPTGTAGKSGQLEFTFRGQQVRP
jgi:predicted ribosomally synthesized peptide with SipW-like signal peptide